jgi:ABC-2 type transport system permease protein
MLGRIRHIVIKEFLQVLRDPRARFVLWGPSVISMLLFGYAATFELKHVPLAILDLDHSQESRELVSHFAATRYFTLRANLEHRGQMEQMIDDGDAVIAIEIHPGFARLLRKGETAPIQVVLDGSNSNTALIALGYVNRIAGEFSAQYGRNRIERTRPAMLALLPSTVLVQRPYYNVNLSSTWFFIPGLIAALILISVMQLTAFAVVREREIGTLEQLMATPVRRIELILGKTIPFFVIGLGDSVLISLVGRIWFGVPLRGSPLLLALGLVPFLLSALGVGLLISTAAKTQQQAMVSGFFVLMPTVTFSGFGTPISTMPAWLQRMTMLNPLRHYVEVLRIVCLKDARLHELAASLLAMALIAAALLPASVARFRKSLE